jgi:hypothetical protein
MRPAPVTCAAQMALPRTWHPVQHAYLVAFARLRCSRARCGPRECVGVEPHALHEHTLGGGVCGCGGRREGGRQKNHGAACTGSVVASTCPPRAA